MMKLGEKKRNTVNTIKHCPYGRVINISLYFIAQFIIIMAARTIWVERGDEGAQHRY